MTVRELYELCCEHNAEMKEIEIEFYDVDGLGHLADNLNKKDIAFKYSGKPVIQFPWKVDAKAPKKVWENE